MHLRGQTARVAGAAIAAGLGAVATAGYAYLVGPLLEGLLTGGAAEIGPWRLEGDDLLWRLPLLIAATALLKATSQLLHGGLALTASQRVMTAVRADLYERWLSLSPHELDRHHSGDLISRFTADVAHVELFVAQALTSAFRDSLQVAALLSICAATDLRLFFLAFVVLPGAIIPISSFARRLKRVAVKMQASLGRLTELTADHLQNLAVVQSYGVEARALAQYDREQASYLSSMRRSLFIRGAVSPTLELLGIVGVAFAIAFGATAVRAEPDFAGKLVSFLAAALLLYQPLKSLSQTAALASSAAGAAGRLFEVRSSPAREEDFGDPAPELRLGLSLREVVAAYEGGPPVLRGLSLEVTAGTRVALVGPSGAGKSTLVSLLLGFLKPTAGEILWDGQRLSALSFRSIREQIAWVSQEPVLFSGTVRDNLRLGRDGATDADLWECLARASAAGFVRQLPGGLDEEIGERGARLSGGQRQRLAIARAFVRRPSLLILDEPTSALDAAAEREVQEGLDELMRGRTTLIIAHRLATVRAADLICVLEGGRVVERGSHDGLLAAGGRYAELLAAGAVRS